MNLSFREYQESDWSSLVDVMCRFWDELRAKDRYERMIHPPEYGEVYCLELLEKVAHNEGSLQLAFSGETLVGLVAGVVEQQSAQNRVELGPCRAGRVLEVYVEPSARGRRVGEQLMARMEQLLIERGCDLLKVEVFALNGEAHRFYHRLGFQDWMVDLFKPIGEAGPKRTP